MAELRETMVTAQDLSSLPLFEGENAEAIEWIASHMTMRHYEGGATVVGEGEPVTDFQVVLEGEVHFGRDSDPVTAVMIASVGQPLGILPYSRMKKSLGRIWVPGCARIAAMDASHLRELVYRAPLLAERLVARMTDRTREATRVAENSNRLAGLGKLAAGLAHELNNPASAAVRSSSRLRDVLTERRQCTSALRGLEVPHEAAAMLAAFGDRITECAGMPGTRDELERADGEADLSDWLEESGLSGQLASPLADAGITPEQLAPLMELASREAVSLGLRILVADHEVLCLTRELEEASKRISDLVQSVKSYSYMDQSPVVEVDVEAGIDATLRMFQFQFKQAVRLERQYHGSLPRIPANGSAVNQIWTNLIDNALDAMKAAPEGARILRVKTCLEPGYAVVEIGDNGPGIPAEVQSRIFDPFFTTKPVGEGTGLGLDIVQRIVRSHKGSVRVQSEPGRTIFQVRLPLAQ